MISWREDDRGSATLETTLMVLILIPLLFAILEFGWLTQRWVVQQGVAVQSARFAGELGGDRAELRVYISEQLRLVGIDPAPVRVEVEPSIVSWREPIRVSLERQERIVIPFLLSASIEVRSTGVARGELNR